jgi:hypothetical protein
MLSCAQGAQPTTPKQPPPQVILVETPYIAMRVSAWVELHAWIAAVARSPREEEDPEVDAAAKGYVAALASDAHDEVLGRTTSALAACNDDDCARAALVGTPFAEPFAVTLPWFLAKAWAEHATQATSGIEVARAAMSAEVGPLVKQIARDLAMTWPTTPPVVDLVTEAPLAGTQAPVGVILATRGGGCLSKHRGEPQRVHDARIIDCVLVRAVLGLRGRSELAQDPSIDRGKWAALVVHAVAAVVTAWEPAHESVLKGPAETAMPEAMAWLAREWPSRLHGESAATFAKRYAAAPTAP